MPNRSAGISAEKRLAISRNPAVIQNLVPTRIIGMTLALPLLLLASSCQRQVSQVEKQDKPKTIQQDLAINGQVFIVTKDAENVRLGELKVFLCPREAFDRLHLLERIKIETRYVMEQFADAKSKGDQCERLVTDIKENYGKLVDERNHLVPQLENAKIYHETYANLKKEIEKRDRTLDQFVAQLRSLGDNSYLKCQSIVDSVANLPQADADFAYKSLAPVSSVCKTDADGRFHFTSPEGQSVVIFTKGDREIHNGQRERYMWFVSAHVSGDDPQKLVLLTNDNGIFSPAPDNLFSTVVQAFFELPSFEIPSSQARKLRERKLMPTEPRWAPDGIFYLLQYASVTTPSGVIGLPPGTAVQQTKRYDKAISLRYGELDLECDRGALTNNADLATEISGADFEAQSQIAAWQAAEREADQLNSEQGNPRDNPLQQRLEEDYKQIHALTGSMLDKR